MIDIRLERCSVEDFQAHQYICLCEYGVKGSMMIKSKNIIAFKWKNTFLFDMFQFVVGCYDVRSGSYIWLVGLKCD